MRVQGITIPDDKRIEIGLTELFGVGRSRSHAILDEAKVDYGKKPADLTEAEEKKVREAIGEYTLEGDLKRQVAANIKRLKDIDSYRGDRHSKGLPVRGQRTRTNSRTVRPYKGRKTAGSGRTKVEKK